MTNVLITGVGREGQVGEALAAHLAAHGARLALVDRTAANVEARAAAITTTDVHLRGKGYSTGAYCSDFGGTSSATPLVAGVAALVLSANKSLRWRAVRSILTSTAEKIDVAGGDYQAGRSLKYGFGRVNAEAAVTKALRSKAGRRRKAARGK